MESNPLAAYDRQRHIQWFEEHFPNFPNWPPEPRTDAEALRYLAQYAPSDVAPVLAWLLNRGYEVSFTKDPEGIVAMIDDHASGL
ncbi:MAG TPA: hypothetical protein VF060_25370, partial [Trebonia sp.]